MTWSLPRLIAHRGGALLAPENTLPAFAEAARRGYRAVECDVALTRDGVPVLLHDRSLKRTAGLDRPVQEVDLATVQTLEAGAWFHPLQRHPRPDLGAGHRLLAGTRPAGADRTEDRPGLRSRAGGPRQRRRRHALLAG